MSTRGGLGRSACSVLLRLARMTAKAHSNSVGYHCRRLVRGVGMTAASGFGRWHETNLQGVGQTLQVHQWVG